MRVILGCDVDPVLPPILRAKPRRDIWKCVDRIEELVRRMGSSLPPITWLIRSDASIEFSTGTFDSGYQSRKTLWSELVGQGHELGWHMHHWSFENGTFRFAPEADWLHDAYCALARHYPIKATRTGWDYGSSSLFKTLNDLGVEIDFSALPGSRSVLKVGRDTVVSDWRLTSHAPYRPSANHYQTPGNKPLRLIEVPLTAFPLSLAGATKRLVWHALHGTVDLKHIGYKYRTLTQRWIKPPLLLNDALALFFHPDELTDDGIRNLETNVRWLRCLPGVEFVTPSELVIYLSSRETRTRM